MPPLFLFLLPFGLPTAGEGMENMKRKWQLADIAAQTHYIRSLVFAVCDASLTYIFERMLYGAIEAGKLVATRNAEK